MIWLISTHVRRFPVPWGWASDRLAALRMVRELSLHRPGVVVTIERVRWLRGDREVACA